MSGQMQPGEEEFERASWEQKKGETEHPEDDLILACVRHQHFDNRIEVQIHIADCHDCQQKYLQYDEVSLQLTGHFRTQMSQQYPSIADRVMVRVEQDSKQTWGKRFERALLVPKGLRPGALEAERVPEEMSPVIGSQFKQPGMFTSKRTSGHIPAILSGKKAARSSLPFLAVRHAPAILVLCLLFSFAIVAALAAPHMGIFPPQQGPGVKSINVQQHMVSPTATKGASPEATARPRHTSTPKGKHRGGPARTPTATPGSGQGAPAILFCSKPADISQWVVRICGSGFKSGDRVLLYVPPSNNNAGGRWIPQVASAQGIVQYTFTINSNCKSVPDEVFAFDMTHYGKLLVLQNISFGSCPVPSPTVSHR